MSIPKIIHYCWFGEKDMPDLVKKCIKSWKKILPDYEFKLWNEENFDINSTKWTKVAYKNKKYAFVSDYVRLCALLEFGGIYLDTDIRVKNSFNNLLNKDAFMGFECKDVLSAGVIGCHPNNEFIEECLEYYKNTRFDEENLNNNINAIMITNKLVRYGLKLDNSKQVVKNIHIYPKTYFNPMDFFGNWDKSDETYCIHLYSGSWLPDEDYKRLARRKKLWWKIGKSIYIKIENIKFINSIHKVLKKKDLV